MRRVRLNRIYKLGESQGCNFILSEWDDECAFLSSECAVLLYFLINCSSDLFAASFASKAFGLKPELCLDKISYLIDRLWVYLDIEYIDDNEGEDLSGIIRDSDFRDVLERISIEEIKKISGRSNTHGHPIKKEAFPSKIKFYLTDYCPRNCIYCFAGAKRFIPGKDQNVNEFVSLERFEELIKEAEQIGVGSIEIAGGDPFILDNIEDYISIAKKNFSGDIGISTKTYVSEEKAKRLAEKGLDEIQVSLDSCDPAIADKMMGCPGAFDEVMETIKNLKAAGIYVTVKAVICSLNIETIPEYFEKMFSMGIDYIRTSHYYRSANRHSDRLFPTGEQLKKLNSCMRPLLDRLKEKGLKTDFVFEEGKRAVKGDERIFCGGFSSSISVRYDGAAMFCDSLNHTDDFTAGNLKQKGIMEIWDSKEAESFSDPAYFHERFKGTECYDCDLYYNCFYKRCFVRTMNEYGTFYEKDPACIKGVPGYMM